MPTCQCPDKEVRTGHITVNNGSGDVDVGDVNLIEWGHLCEKHPQKNPVYNVVYCVKEYVNGLYIVATLDCSKYEVLGDLFMGVPATVIGAANPPLPTGAAGMIGPVGINDVIYLDAQGQLGDQYHGPYVGVTFSTDVAGVFPIAEGVDYEFGDTDGGFIVNQADPSAINGTYVYIQAGTYTTSASVQYRFDECAIDSSMSVLYEHPMQDCCPAENIFTIYMPDAYIVDCISATDSPDDVRNYQIRWESLWHEPSAGYELGYYSFGTAACS